MHETCKRTHKYKHVLTGNLLWHRPLPGSTCENLKWRGYKIPDLVCSEHGCMKSGGFDVEELCCYMRKIDVPNTCAMTSGDCDEWRRRRNRYRRRGRADCATGETASEWMNRTVSQSDLLVSVERPMPPPQRRTVTVQTGRRGVAAVLPSAVAHKIMN